MPPHIRNTDYDLALFQNSRWLINGALPSGGVADYLDIALGETVGWGRTRCPYCRTLLYGDQYEDHGLDRRDWVQSRLCDIGYCPRCAYWDLRYIEPQGDLTKPTQVVLASSVASRFESRLPDFCAMEIAKYLRRTPTGWHSLDPRTMEVLVADIFRANYSNCEVIHVGKPGDRGIDVIFIDASETRWLIQVKRRSKLKATEGFATLQSILGTLVLEGERHGIVATTADSFSYQAQRAASKAREYGYVVELADKGVLDRMLGELLPTSPWLALLDRPVLYGLSPQARKFFAARLSASVGDE